MLTACACACVYYLLLNDKTEVHVTTIKAQHRLKAAECTLNNNHSLLPGRGHFEVQDSEDSVAYGDTQTGPKLQSACTLTLSLSF